MNYKGQNCFCCNNEFSEIDDVVVCPDCGTPYHRDCYSQQGNCINEQLHNSGKVWTAVKILPPVIEPTETITDSSDTPKTCPSCFTSNQPDAINCVYCHCKLSNNSVDREFKESVNETYSDIYDNFDLNKPCFGFDPNEDFDGVALNEIFSFVKTNNLYYIPLFRKFKATGKKISMNLSCLLFPHAFFASRKMWLMTILVVIISLILRVPSILLNITELVSYESDGSGLISIDYIEQFQFMFKNIADFVTVNTSFIERLNELFSTINVLFQILMCLLANWLYYRFTLKSIGNIKKNNPEKSNQLRLINSSGGISMTNILLSAVIWYFAYAVISAIIYSIGLLL